VYTGGGELHCSPGAKDATANGWEPA
jgi:hypothetical protein